MPALYSRSEVPFHSRIDGCWSPTRRAARLGQGWPSWSGRAPLNPSSGLLINAGRLRGGRQGWAATPAPPARGIAPGNPKLMWLPGEMLGADGSVVLSHSIHRYQVSV